MRAARRRRQARSPAARSEHKAHATDGAVARYSGSSTRCRMQAARRGCQARSPAARSESMQLLLLRAPPHAVAVAQGAECERRDAAVNHVAQQHAARPRRPCCRRRRHMLQQQRYREPHASSAMRLPRAQPSSMRREHAAHAADGAAPRRINSPRCRARKARHSCQARSATARSKSTKPTPPMAPPHAGAAAAQGAAREQRDTAAKRAAQQHTVRARSSRR